MYRYAQLNNENMVIAISQLSGKVIADNLINIDNLQVELGDIYDNETNTFIPPITVPIEPQPAIEEQILAETQYQTALIEMNMMGGI